MATFISVNSLIITKKTNNAIYMQVDITVDRVVSLLFPIDPKAGQPNIIEKKPKNNVGINNLKMGTASKYFSPPNIINPIFVNK